MTYKKHNEEQINQMLSNAKASLAMEGLYVTPEEEALVKRKFLNEISEEEFLQRVMELINKQ